jgi:putative mRNA 3-end processing factor
LDLITTTDAGLFCAAGGFHIDPWKPVDRAVITHGHSDHARLGSKRYLCAAGGEDILCARLGADINLQSVAYGEAFDLNGVRVSLHPAGHLLGSAQVRVEHHGEVWVISGDYKTQADATCAAFVPVKCDVFITESTFGLPIYRWKPQQTVFDEINGWWRENQAADRTSIIYAYALGKAQRLLGGLDPSIGPILLHGAVSRLTEVYERVGVKLPAWSHATPESAKQTRGKAMVIAPPSAQGTPWLRKFGEQSSAAASGWMQVRGNRRRGNVDRGFVLSDHADWDGLLSTIRATGAQRIGVTHGSVNPLARYLNENGWQASVYPTHFSNRGEEEDASDAGEPA